MTVNNSINSVQTLDSSSSPVFAALSVTGIITTATWNGQVIGPTYGGTGVNNGLKTITLGGALTTSGAFDSTFTMTGTTNVTFPTSGTLATTAGTVSSGQGTSNQVLVNGTSGAPQTGALIFTLPQSIGTGNSPTFAGLTLTSFSGVVKASAGVLSASTIVNADLASGSFTNITGVGTLSAGTWNATVVTGQYGGTGIANTGLTITLANGAVGKVLVSDVSGNATWAALSGVGVTSITGTSNQVTANGSAVVTQTGAVTLALDSTVVVDKLGVGVTPGSARSVAFLATITASAGTAIGFLTSSGNTYTCAANSNSIVNVQFNPGTIATGSFTGLSFYNLQIVNSGATKTGTGTITNYYGIYGDAASIAATNSYGCYILKPTGSTNNYTAYFDPGVSIGAVAGDVFTFRVNCPSTANTYYQVVMDGTVVQTDNGASNGGQLGINLSTGFTPTLGANVCYGLSSQCNFIAPNTKTITEVAGLRVYNFLSSNVGTISTAYGLKIDGGSSSTGTVTAAYGLYVIAPSHGTSKYTARFDMGTTGGFGIGVAPSSVMNISANSGTSQYWIDWRGTHTIVASSFSVGFNFGPTLQPASSCSAVSFDLNPLFNTSSANITTAYGLVIEALSNAGGGTITTSYGLYVSRPSGGTSKYTAYLDLNIGIGGTPNAGYGIYLGGTLTSNDGGNFQIAQHTGTSFAPATNTTNIVSQYIYLTRASSAGSVTNSFGIYVDAGGNSGGAVTSSYGIYVANPGFGTTKTCIDCRGRIVIGADTGSSVPNLYVTGITGTASSGVVTGGSAQALPANPVGYIGVVINGNSRAIPYYAASFF